jgi:hypothetical protein
MSAPVSGNRLDVQAMRMDLGQRVSDATSLRSVRVQKMKPCMKTVVLGFGIKTTCELMQGHKGACR